MYIIDTYWSRWLIFLCIFSLGVLADACNLRSSMIYEYEQTVYFSEYVLKLGDRDTRPQVLRNWGFHIGTSFRNLYGVPTANQKCQRKNIGDLRKIKVQITVSWNRKKKG